MLAVALGIKGKSREDWEDEQQLGFERKVHEFRVLKIQVSPPLLHPFPFSTRLSRTHTATQLHGLGPLWPIHANVRPSSP
jgi:hypothetical protein